MQNILRRKIVSAGKNIFSNKIIFNETIKKNNFNYQIMRRGFAEETKSNKNEKEQNKNENEENKNENEEPQEENQTEYKTSRKIRFAIGKIIKYTFMFGGLLTLYNAFLYKRKGRSASEHKGYVEPLNKLVKNIHYFWFITYGSLTLPYYERILPDALELQGHPAKKTLVINLNKTLINYEYKFGSGFEILKRPGLLKFLQEMGQIYEVVIFGTEDSNFVEEVCGKLDQFDMNIKYKLGKEATRLVNGTYVKDLYFLNRDLKNVIMIDYSPDNVIFNLQNTVIIPEFRGDGKDRELLQSIVFLKELAKSDVRDVRKELEKYGSFRPYIKFYKSNPKYQRLLPKEDIIAEDPDLQYVIASK